MKTGLQKSNKYPFIKSALNKHFGKKEAAKLLSAAEAHYIRLEQQCQDATPGEWTHLRDTILPTAATYLALRSREEATALSTTRSIIIGMCEKISKIANKILKLPGMASLFMQLLPKMALNLFGEKCGFTYEGYTATKTQLTMNMTSCPYCRYAQLLDVAELVPIFCESDFATYGHLECIRFTRSQTLGTGGEMCDFRFERVK